MLNPFDSRNWLENFCDTFLYFCDQLNTTICRQTTRLRKPVSVHHSVAITLWMLSTSCEYHTVGCNVKDTVFDKVYWLSHWQLIG